MKKFKKIGLIICYILIWLLFIFNLTGIYAGIIAILNGDMGHWFIFIIIVILPFFFGYLLRHHFKVLLKLITKFLLFMKNIKLTLPVTILLGCIILGGFFYVSQINKQKSIERQQILKQMEDRRMEDAKAEQEKAKETFSNNLKCQTLLKDLKQRWNNVVGIYYDETLNTCIVKYTKKGETEEAPIENMQDE